MEEPNEVPHDASAEAQAGDRGDTIAGGPQAAGSAEPPAGTSVHPGFLTHVLDAYHPGPSMTLARIHQAVLPDSPVARLGTRFGSSIYYGAFPAGGLTFGAYATVAGVPVGLAVGTDDPGGFMTRGVSANLGRLMLLSPTLIRPRALGALTEAIRIRGTQASHDEHPVPTGQVLTIGLLPSYRGGHTGVRGIGRALLDQLVGQLAQLGARRAYLLVDEQNESAQRFYVRNGWHVAGEPVTSWRTPQLRMERDIAAPGAGDDVGG